MTEWPQPIADLTDSSLTAGRHILLANDDCISRRLLQFQLRQWGHSVLTAEDGHAAWELLQTHHCPIVITDWMMPGLNGIELIGKIREAARTKYTYVILLTSTTNRSAMVTALTGGADDYLTKPVDKDELKARLQPGLRIIDLEHRLAERNGELETRNRLLSQSNEKMKSDLDSAARIQQACLPRPLTDCPNVGFAWHYMPCTELAGDMLNIQRLDADHIAVYVLDVSGHGVQAALLAVSASRYLSSHKDPSSVLWHRSDNSANYQLQSPAAAINQLNLRFTNQALAEQYFTLVYGILNQRSGEFRYSIAGHPAPLLVDRFGELTHLPGSGLPVGIMETEYEEHSVQLEPGDRLFFYSDGVTESMNSADELFGSTRFDESLRRSPERPLDNVLLQVLCDIKSWSGEAPIRDDISLLALEFLPDSQDYCSP